MCAVWHWVSIASKLKIGFSALVSYILYRYIYIYILIYFLMLFFLTVTMIEEKVLSISWFSIIVLNPKMNIPITLQYSYDDELCPCDYFLFPSIKNQQRGSHSKNSWEHATHRDKPTEDSLGWNLSVRFLLYFLYFVVV